MDKQEILVRVKGVARELRRSTSNLFVDPVALGLKMGVIFLESDSCIGRSDLVRDENDKFIIRISKSAKVRFSRERMRFVIAHELGHVVLINNWFEPAQTFSDAKKYYQVEKICNEFAASLLVDEEYVLGEARRTGTQLIAVVNQMSSLFGVSKEVVARIIVAGKKNTCLCLVDMNSSTKPT
ncbi:MAG: ImmA/IrrE family metallo-endopeptidase, partial [Prosthecobacter sp.]|nr:ImmA/IrrE family metallo-endopeptidase [Prosthecobacter sp.]